MVHIVYSVIDATVGHTSLGVEALNVDLEFFALVKDVIKVFLVQSWAEKRVAKHAWGQWLGLNMALGGKCFGGF